MSLEDLRIEVDDHEERITTLESSAFKKTNTHPSMPVDRDVLNEARKNCAKATRMRHITERKLENQDDKMEKSIEIVQRKTNEEIFSALNELKENVNAKVAKLNAKVDRLLEHFGINDEDDA